MHRAAFASYIEDDLVQNWHHPRRYHYQNDWKLVKKKETAHRDPMVGGDLHVRTVCTHSTTSGIKRLPWFVVSAVQFERVNVEYTNRCPHTTFDANPAAIPASLGHPRHSPLNHILQSTATSVQFPSGDGVCFFQER